MAIAEARFVVEAVQVKLLIDPNHIEDFGNIQSQTIVFRVYSETRFSELKSAACSVWKKIEQSF